MSSGDAPDRGACRPKHCLLGAFIAALFLSIFAFQACQAPEKATAQPGTVVAKVLMPRNDIPGLGNFAKVSDALYRGAQPTAEGFQALEKMGVKTVVNLRSSHSDKELLAGTTLKYIAIPATATGVGEEQALAFLCVMRDPANHPVFVHCRHGADRTGLAVAVYRMTEQDWTNDDAVAELPRFGFHRIWINIKRYLESFDAETARQKLKDADAATSESREAAAAHVAD